MRQTIVPAKAMSRLLICCGLLIAALPATARAQDVVYPNEAFAKLDVFEGNNLTKADRAFTAKQYKQSLAAYDAFLVEFPNSEAVPYALYRKGRSLQLDNKRFEAIKCYTQVLDFFPNAVEFASASLFEIGRSHADNGDVDKASKFWIKLADDKQYSKQPSAAAAINDLGNYLLNKGEGAKASIYFEQAAVDFRYTNPNVARAAINSIVRYLVRTKPDEPRLRTIYQKAGGLDHTPQKVATDATNDPSYIRRVIRFINELAEFTKEQAAEREAYYRYWSGVFEGRLPLEDDIQIALINYKLEYEKDRAKWVQRIDKQFNNGQSTTDSGRIVRFVSAFADERNKATEYMAKLKFDQLKPLEILPLYIAMADGAKDQELGRAVFAKIPLAKVTDAQRENNFMPEVTRRNDEKLTADVCNSYDDKARGQFRLFLYYFERNINDKALAMADAVAKAPEYATETYYRKGLILQRIGKLPEAIAAYKLADNAPANLFQIAECLVGLKKFDEAVAQLREIENFFKPNAAQACLRIARVYRSQGLPKEKLAAALRNVLKGYPGSPESSEAHLELESLGYKRLGGGQDAD
jgi:tetratricopeptide (TPR) repeat protein